MLPQDWESLVRAAMVSADLTNVPTAARRRVVETVAGRLELHGVRGELHNWGGVLCGRADHASCCEDVGGRRWQRFTDDASGVRRLVELAGCYTGVKRVGGFRSELRTEGFFGPNEASERTFQELSAAWAGLEAEVGVEKLRTGFAKTSYAAWIAFRDKWKAGDADTTALGAMVADVNVTRQNLGKSKVDIRPPDVTQTTAALQTFKSVDDAAKGAGAAAGDLWRSIPLPVKLGAAVTGGVGVLGILAVIASNLRGRR